MWIVSLVEVLFENSNSIELESSQVRVIEVFFHGSLF